MEQAQRLLHRATWRVGCLIAATAVSAVLLAPPARAAGDAQVVKIGFAAPLSGGDAHYGKDMQYGAQIAIDEANAQHWTLGGKPVQFKLLAEDDQADPRTGAAVAQKLVDEQVVGVVGHFNSGTSIPASRIYANAGIPQISPASTNPLLTSQGYKTVFRVINTDAQMGRYAARYAVKVLKVKRIAIVDDRTAFGRGMADEFEKAVKADGGNVVAHEFGTDHTVDFSAILTKLKGAQADLIFYAGLDQQAAPLAKQMRQLGLKAQLMGGGGFTNKNFIQMAGPAADGVRSWEYGLPLERMPGGKAFEAKMKQKYGVDIVAYSPFTYDATWALLHAMKQADSTDPAKYLGALAKIYFDGVTGPIAFLPNGDLQNPPATLYQVKDQQWVPLQTSHGE